MKEDRTATAAPCGYIHTHNIQHHLYWESKNEYILSTTLLQKAAGKTEEFM